MFFNRVFQPVFQPVFRRRALLNATAIARLLFSDDEPGFFYDFDDWSTLFQNTAGTIPVTTPNQGVALALDKSGNDNHAAQATTAARPLTAVHPDGGVRNEIDGSDTLATQTVTVTAQERTLSFRGTGTVTLSGASTAGPLVGTGADDIVSLTFTPTAGSLTLTVSGAVNDAMLELGAVRTNYQRRVNHLDVTEAGKRSIRRLYFNGTSHFMECPAQMGVENELSTFIGYRSDVPANSNGYLFSSAGGQSQLSNHGASFLSLSGNAESYTVGGEANDLPRIVGAGRVFSSSGSKTTGDLTFGFEGNQQAGSAGSVSTADTTRIGARAGGVFFLGFLDQFIMRGALTDTATIEKTEKYVSTKSPEVPTL